MQGNFLWYGNCCHSANNCPVLMIFFYFAFVNKGRTINHCGGVSGRDFDLAFFFYKPNEAMGFNFKVKL